MILAGVVIALWWLVWIAARIYDNHQPLSPEYLEEQYKKHDAEIAKLQASISALHLDIFHGVPYDDLFEWLMFKAGNASYDSHWEMSEQAFTQVRTLLPTLTPRETMTHLLGLPIKVVPGAILDAVKDDEECQTPRTLEPGQLIMDILS